jgi:MFS transporter, DHA2 family, multidrug resistance protein
VPVMALLLAVGRWLLPEFRDPKAEMIDVASAVLSLVAVLAMIYGVKELASHGAGVIAFAVMAAGLALGWIFIRRQKTLSHPFVDLSLFARSAFRAALLVNLTGAFLIGGIYLFVAQFLQLVLGLSPLNAALWLLPSSLAFVLGSALVPAFAHRWPPRQLMTGGLVLAAAGFAVLLFVRHAGGIPVLIAGLTLFSFGFTPVASLTTDLVVSSAPPERAGAAAALSETAFELGAALGIALLGSLGAAIYRTQMMNAVPEDLAPAAAEAARSTLGGAAAVAEDLPAIADSLLAAARAAFTDGLVTTAAIGVVCLVLLAAHVRRALRA